MNKNILLRCSECGKEYSFGAYSCKCNNGVLLVEYDFMQVKSIDELEILQNLVFSDFLKRYPLLKNIFHLVKEEPLV